MKKDTQSQCSGKIQRDRVGKEMEGGSGKETHVHLWLIHVDVWQKLPQYCKVNSLQFK